ncbi:tetraspanin-18-like [Gigantopelta aegis]|uniref:tetraspanin-18-like n=1 Tax=Gigantopelta aegis TaxID=1735272 RepID=UPI001B88D923|nr:tetraspanin-18-like [Gigantopelta aegis]
MELDTKPLHPSEESPTLGIIIKYVFVVWSVVLILMGASAFGAGVWILMDEKYSLNLIQAVTSVLVFSGGMLFILGFLATCAALLEHKGMLIVYIVILMVLLCSQGTASVIMVVKWKAIENELNENLVKNVEENYDGKVKSASVFSAALDWTQVTLYCCGINKFSEFQKAKNWKARETKMVPETCCILTNRDKFFLKEKPKVKVRTCPQDPTATDSYISTPCFNGIKELLMEKWKLFLGVLCVVLIFEVSGVVFSSFILWKIHKKELEIV